MYTISEVYEKDGETIKKTPFKGLSGTLATLEAGKNMLITGIVLGDKVGYLKSSIVEDFHKDDDCFWVTTKNTIYKLDKRTGYEF